MGGNIKGEAILHVNICKFVDKVIVVERAYCSKRKDFRT